MPQRTVINIFIAITWFMAGLGVVNAQVVAPSSSGAQVNPLGSGAQVRPLAPPSPSQGLKAPTSPLLIDRVVAIVNRTFRGHDDLGIGK